MLHQQLDDKTERIENLKQRLLEAENRKVTIEVCTKIRGFEKSSLYAKKKLKNHQFWPNFEKSSFFAKIT